MGASSDRQYNPYEAHDSHSMSYDDPNAVPRQHIRAPLQYHLSAPPLPHTSNLHPHHMAHHAYFMDSNLREELFRRNEAINITSVPSAQELGGPIRQPQPDEVHVYKDLVALEPDSSGPLPYASRGNPVTIGGVPTQLLPRHLLPLNSSGGLQGMGSLANLPISSSGGPLAASMSLCRYPTEVHKATCTLDGKAYVLRRIAGFNLGREKEKALEGVERWRRLRCAGVVNVREAFTSWKWGEPSIVFVYDYHPHSNTLFAEHLLNRPMRQDPRTGRMQAAETHVTEKKMWSYIVQIAGALKKVHGEGLSVRSLEASKILLTGKNRVRINCCSILDVLLYDPANPSTPERTLQYQQEDLHQLGLLILVLANRNSAAAHAQNVDASLDALSKHYSKEMRDVVAWLLRDPLEFGGAAAASGNGPQSPSRPHHRQSSYPSTSSLTNTNDSFNRSKDASTLLSMIAPHVATEMESSLHYNDLLESSLSLELENARLMKILVKMGFINERPEFDWDSSWSSTGERYLVGLFRDWLFHSNEEAGSSTSAPNSGGGGGSGGRAGPFQPGGGGAGGGQGHQQQRGPKPLVDLSFVLTNLNRLDAGSEEKIMLTSRDEQSCLVVSYKEVSTQRAQQRGKRDSRLTMTCFHICRSNKPSIRPSTTYLEVHTIDQRATYHSFLIRPLDLGSLPVSLAIVLLPRCTFPSPSPSSDDSLFKLKKAIQNIGNAYNIEGVNLFDCRSSMTLDDLQVTVTLVTSTIRRYCYSSHCSSRTSIPSLESKTLDHSTCRWCSNVGYTLLDFETRSW